MELTNMTLYYGIDMCWGILIKSKSLLALEVLILGLVLVTVPTSCDEELVQLESELFDVTTESLNPVEYYETLQQWEAVASRSEVGGPMSSMVRTMLELSELDKSKCSKELVEKFQWFYQDPKWSVYEKARNYISLLALLQFNICVQEFDRISRRNMAWMSSEHNKILNILVEGTQWLGETKMQDRWGTEDGLYGNECKLHTESRRLVASAAYYMWQEVEGISRADHHSDEQHWEHFSTVYSKLLGGSFCDPIRETYRELGSDWEYSSLLIWVRWKLQLEIHREWDRMETLCHFLVLGEGDFATRKTYEYFKMHLDGRKRYYPAAEVVGVGGVLARVISTDPYAGESMSNEMASIYDMLDKAGMGHSALGLKYLKVHETHQQLMELTELWPNDWIKLWKIDRIGVQDLQQIARFQESHCKSDQEFENRLRIRKTFSDEYYNLHPYVSYFNRKFFAACEMIIRLEAERIFSSVPHDQVMRIELMRRRDIKDQLSNAAQQRTHLSLNKNLVDKVLVEYVKQDLMNDISDGLEPLTTFTGRLEGIRQKLCQGLTGPDVDRLLQRVAVQFKDRGMLIIGQGTRLILTYMRICNKGPIEDWRILATYGQYKLEVLCRSPKSRWSLLRCLKPEVKDR